MLCLGSSSSACQSSPADPTLSQSNGPEQNDPQPSSIDSLRDTEQLAPAVNPMPSDCVYYNYWSFPFTEQC